MGYERSIFFDRVRRHPFSGRLASGQVAGLAAVLDAWEARNPIEGPAALAYVLATAFHETAATMQPVRETLAKTDQLAVARLESAYSAGRLRTVKTPYWRYDADGRTWLGRGLVQLTHRRNYQKMSALMVANFYSRARDFRSFVKGKDMWNEFYDEVEAMFHEKCKAEIDFNINPMIAILKEESKPEFGKAQFLPLGYTACIMYQEHGKDPKVMVIYQQFMEVVELSQKFTVQKSSSRLYKIGIYRDETRAHLEPKRESPSKMVVRSRSDFARK